MSFVSIFSFLAANIAPKDLNFWGVGSNWFISLWAHVCDWFYGIVKWFLAFVDFLQYFIQKLIGLDYWLANGSKTLQGATENDLLFSFLYNETVQRVFRAMLGLFVVFLIVFTIFAIVKQEWKFVTGTEKQNTKTTIIAGSLKAIALVLFVPLILVIGIVSSNAILASIVKALNVDMSSSFGNTIFSVGAVSANRYRNYADSYDRLPMSTNVTFYIGNPGTDYEDKLIQYGSTDGVSADGLVYTIADYKTYLEVINDASKSTKHIVGSVFQMFDPDDEMGKKFYGYCAKVGDKYYMVYADDIHANSTYYYLKHVLKASIVTSSIGDQGIISEIDGKWGNTSRGYISELNISDYGNSSQLVQACYNTRDYATLYMDTHDYENTISSKVYSVDIKENFKLTGHSGLKVMYNSGNFEKYFDGGQTNMVSLNAEYGVMADVIDFMCETGANLYILDATSDLIEWNYQDYSVDTKWVANLGDSRGEMVTIGDSTYLPFIVEYSETASDYEEGRVLYLAKDVVSNELHGSKYIMCFKVSVGGGLRYVPLVNRKFFIDPNTGTSYFFSSDYLSTSYNGVVVAKGNFDAHEYTNDPASGAPTYLKAYNGDGSSVIDVESEPYYYNISEDKMLSQTIAKTVAKEGETLAINTIFTGITFDNKEFAGYSLFTGANIDGVDNRHLYRIAKSEDGDALELSSSVVEKLSIQVQTGGKTMKATYAGVNDGKNYLFVTNDGYVLVVQLVESADDVYKYFTVRGVGESGEVLDEDIIMFTETLVESDCSTLKTTKLSYTITLKYDNIEQLQEILPAELSLSKTITDGEKYLFSTEKLNTEIINDGEVVFNQYMALNFYLRSNSLYSIAEGMVALAEPSTDSYDLQIFNVDLYNFLTAYVDENLNDSTEGAIKEYDASQSGFKNSTNIIKTIKFGVFEDEFSWNKNSTEYLVYNGSSYVAKLIKAVNDDFSFENITQKTLALEIDGVRYYNLKTQNAYADDGAMKTAYQTIYNSMFVASCRDRIDTTPKWDFKFGFGNDNFRFNWTLGNPYIVSEQIMDDDQNNGIFSLSDGIQFDYFFEGDKSLMQFYNPCRVAYWLILIAAAMIIKTLGTALWGVIKRFYEITLHYLALPVAASTIPLDGGTTYKKIQDALIQHVLGTYGVILGINVFFVLLEPVKSMSNIFTQAEMDSSTSYFLKHFPFSAKILNSFVYILFVLVAFTMIDTLPKVINGFVGGKDVHDEGKQTKANVGKTIQSSADMISGKSAMDFAGKAIDTLSKSPLSAPLKGAAGLGKKVVGGLGEAWRSRFSQAQSDAYAEEGEKKGSTDESKRTGDDDVEGGAPTTTETTPTTTETPTTTPTDGTPVVENSITDGTDSTTEGDGDSEIPQTEEEIVAAEYNKGHSNTTANSAGMKAAVMNLVDGDSAKTAKVASNLVTSQGGGLTPEQVVEIVKQVLGDQVKGMSDEEISKNYGLGLDTDMFGNIVGATVKNNADGSETKLEGDQFDNAMGAIVAKADANKFADATKLGLSDDDVDQVDGVATFTFGSGANALDGASDDALKLFEHMKGDEDVINEMLLNKILNGDDKTKQRFFEQTGLGENSSKEDMLETFTKFKAIGGSNVISSAVEAFNENGSSFDGDIANVIRDRVKAGNIGVTAWDLASQSEKDAHMAAYKKANHILTDEEKVIEGEMLVNNFKGLKSTNETEYNDKLAEAFLASDISSEDKDLVFERLFLDGLTDKNGNIDHKAKAYKDAIDVMGKNGIDFADLNNKGHNEKDVLLAFQKLKALGFKDGEITQDYIEDMIANGDNQNDAILNGNDAMKKKLVGIIDDDSESALLTSSERNSLVESIALADGNQGDYDAIHAEAEERKKIEAIFASQGGMITAEMLNSLDGNEKQALINEINSSLGTNVTELTDDLIEQFVNNDDNLGEESEALKDLKKAYIKKMGVDSFTDVINEGGLSGSESEQFKFKKALLEEQIRREGANGTTLSTLFDNANFVGKDKIESLIESVLNKMGIKDAKNATPEQRQAAISKLLGEKTDKDFNADVDAYMKANGLKKKDRAIAEDAVRKQYEDMDNVRGVLLSIGATDVNNALTSENQFEKRVEAIKSDKLLSRMFNGVDLNDKAAVEAVIANNAEAGNRLNDIVNGMIDPNKHMSAEDRDNFFKTHAMNAPKPISYADRTPFVNHRKGFINSIRHKITHNLPENHARYDEWNKQIDREIALLKSGKGVYEGLSKEEKAAKFKELMAKKINAVSPEEFASWDNDTQTKYSVEQLKLKKQAFETNYSKINRTYKKINKKVADGNVVLNFTGENGITFGKVDYANKSEKNKQTLRANLMLAEANIDRFNATAPMRNRSQDFGQDGFNKFASTYFDSKAVGNLEKEVEKRLKKKGIKDPNSEDAIKIREEVFAEKLNKDYRVASAKVAKSNGVDAGEYLKEKGVDRGSVRFRDGTKKYLQVKSRIPGLTHHREKQIKKFEQSAENHGGIATNWRWKRYQKSYYYKNSEEYAIRLKNEAKRNQQIRDALTEFASTYKGDSKNFKEAFKNDPRFKHFGADIDKLYSEWKKSIKGKFGNLANKSVKVQHADLMSLLDEQMNKNKKRQSGSPFIPASSSSTDRFRGQEFSNKKTKAQLDIDKLTAEQYNKLLKQVTEKGFKLDNNFSSQLTGIVKAEFDKRFKNGVKPSDLGAVTEFLRKKTNHYNLVVRNNTFTPADKKNLTSLGGTLVSKSEVKRATISPIIRKSLNETQMSVYKDLIKKENSAQKKITTENYNLETLKKALAEVKGANAARRKADIEKAIKDAEIRLKRITATYEKERGKRKAFERSYASEQIKRAIRENPSLVKPTGSVVEKYKFNGTNGVIKPGTPEARNVEAIVRNFMSNYRSKLDEIIKSLLGAESTKLKEYVNKKYKNLSHDFADNFRSLVNTQRRIREEMKTLATKTDSKSKKYLETLKTKDGELETIIGNMTKEFEKMGIKIKRF